MSESRAAPYLWVLVLVLMVVAGLLVTKATAVADIAAVAMAYIAGMLVMWLRPKG